MVHRKNIPISFPAVCVSCLLYTSDMDLNVAVWILDVVLFLMGAAVMGKKFALTVIVSTATFPMFLSILNNIPALQTMTQDRLLSAIYAGILMGLAIGIVIRQGASTGGMDLSLIHI